VPNLRVSLGLRIEELRNSLRLSRDELAKRTGVDARQIANYELYGAWPLPETLSKLIDGLGIEIHDLFDFTDTRKRCFVSFQERLANRGQRSDRGLARRKPSPDNKEQ
jgi:transcriptional regulator with XRE-family HTH domain